MKRYSDLTVTELAERLNQSASRHAAVEECYNRYFARLYVQARSLIKDDWQAEDLIHDVFTRLLTRDIQLNPSQGIFAYIYGSVRNAFFDRIANDELGNNYRDYIKYLSKEGDYTTDNMVQNNEKNKAIEHEIENLPPKMREVFELRRKECLSYKEIAERTNTSVNTVKTQIAKALKILRGKLGPGLFLNLMLFILFINRH